LERQGKLTDARKIYERSLQHLPNDAQLHACYAHLLWRQGKKEDAFSAVERALRLAPGYEWAWRLLSEWATDCGQSDRTANFSRALTRERPGELRVWLMLARVLSDPVALSERLAAVEKALELNAHSTEAWDLKAELLANAERFDEAIRTCENGVAVCPAEVRVLHGRRAWIEARRRQFPEAVRLMRAVLAENASYVWGWNQLAQWLSEQGEFAEQPQPDEAGRALAGGLALASQRAAVDAVQSLPRASAPGSLRRSECPGATRPPGMGTS
jgi:predicted Zn-dependent protease